MEYVGVMMSRTPIGTVKVTDLRAYSAPCPLPKLLILRSTDDQFRLQNPRILLSLTVPLGRVKRSIALGKRQSEGRLEEGLREILEVGKKAGPQ